MAVIKVICGLGNPGSSYWQTRHNLGRDVVDRLAVESEAAEVYGFDRFECRSMSAGANDIYLIKPTTFVNRSGLAVKEAVFRFGIAPSELFVINDDFDLSLGSIRIRKSGSGGGHRGLISIINQLGSSEFPRLRMGIGPLPNAALADRNLVQDFVLDRFLPEESKTVEEMISHVLEAIKLIVNDCLDQAINKYNHINPTPER